MVVFPNAKINIGLNILRKRKDNFHEIETVFYPVKLCDILEIIINPANSQVNRFTNTGININAPTEKNLVEKAYLMLTDEFKLPEITMQLHKIIPFGAGLGGGSSDAAFTILLLNKLFSLNLTSGKMIDYAGRLGSDCPFFILNKPLLAEGKGDILQPVDLNLSGWFITLVKPPFDISTSQAYEGIQTKIPSHKLIESIQSPPDQWRETITNDFERLMFSKYPELEQIKNKLYKQGAAYASMSGSGSTIYGIFKSETNVSVIFPKYFVWSGIL